MFELIQAAPPDPILGLGEAFRNDPRTDKINLSVGVFQDDDGRTPMLACVKEAERRLLERETNKNYLGIDGHVEFRRRTAELLLGVDSAAIAQSRVATVQSPGGTGALRIAADLIGRQFPGATVWISQPTWPNHPQIFQAAGLLTASHPYLDAAGTGLDLDAMLRTLETARPGDALLLHASCHNPSGIDPDATQWERISNFVRERGLLPILDCAYQGFGRGLDEDVVGVRRLAESGETLICSSCSKNFGLYGERVGALTIVASDADAAKATGSQAKACVRANYSNPPIHGAAVVAEILGDATLTAQWHDELAAMRRRIHAMRQAFVAAMAARVPNRDFSFIADQLGMFSFSGLTPMQVDRLKSEYGIYIVGSGRINVAGITRGNLDRLCDAIATVL
ncbi:MAG TPA: aromatic amino acid aminotransferase [Planctomycetaceae bacterium]|nr:aromatic amino acid aminotransferase [Planctomycetaceae bacterium]HRF01465.1 amino acid aminotransferase [Pirellulaceae bacterium]